jgi:hypothetical protein
MWCDINKVPRKKIVFISGLFNDAVSSKDYAPSNDTVINELERLWKEAFVV